jgi:hypothetical protein
MFKLQTSGKAGGPLSCTDIIRIRLVRSLILSGSISPFRSAGLSKTRQVGFGWQREVALSLVLRVGSGLQRLTENIADVFASQDLAGASYCSRLPRGSRLSLRFSAIVAATQAASTSGEATNTGCFLNQSLVGQLYLS